VLIHVHDVPESALVHVLRAASSPRPGSVTPPLPEVLSRVVNCSTSAAPLRAALRETLRADDLPPILAILSSWLAFWSGLNAPADASGRRTSPPPLDPTLAFAQALLDAHLIVLLQDERSREAARELGEAVATLVRLTDELESLRAPLAALALVPKPVRASKVQGERKSVRQTAHELHMAVGLYTRETFTL